ncbi:hypothetical protein Tco_1002288 [Tanacetum coccineum]|uniref:Uncharacterized protein n=1 Tax=Tanacetum coccineum TaxID=301880 RepID=A0ABQ5F770_9ASTR
MNCNHNTPLSSRKVSSFDGPEPQPLLNSPSLDVSLGDVIGPEPSIKTHSPDSSRMKVVDYLTTQTPPSPHVVNVSYAKGGILLLTQMFDDDWGLESKEVSPLGEELSLFDRPNKVERGRILEAHRLEPILQQQISQRMAPSHNDVIMEYLVNISKRRAFWSLNQDILKITILKTNTSYQSRKIRLICVCTHQRPQRNKAQYTVSRDTQYAVSKIMDEHSMTMEEYIKLEEEKARRRGQVFNWQTATYGKIRVDDDLYNLRSMEAEFPAIVIDDTFTPQDALPCKSQNFLKCLNGSDQAKCFESRIRFFARLIEEFGFALHRVEERMTMKKVDDQTIRVIRRRRIDKEGNVSRFQEYHTSDEEEEEELKGNMNGWLTEDANDSDLESTASNQPMNLTIEDNAGN